MAKDKSSFDPIPAPSQWLVVMEGFADYRRGDAIRDQEEINRILSSEQACHVNLIREQNND